MKDRAASEIRGLRNTSRRLPHDARPGLFSSDSARRSARTAPRSIGRDAWPTIRGWRGRNPFPSAIRGLRDHTFAPSTRSAACRDSDPRAPRHPRPVVTAIRVLRDIRGLS
jgi:hypothetical protein